MTLPVLPAAAFATLVFRVGGPAPQAPGPQDPPPIFGAGRGIELTLDGALELALRNNLGLEIEALATESLLHATRGSWGAFDWVASGSASVTDEESESSSIFSSSMTNTQTLGFELARPFAAGGTFRANFDTTKTKTDSQFAALGTSTLDIVSLSYVQPLLRGAWREYATANQRIADLDWRRQVEREREVRQRVLRSVADAYWDLVAAQEQQEVSRASLDLARAQLDQDRRRLDAGVGTPLDVISAETQVASREESALLAETRARQAGDALRELVFRGVDPGPWETALIPTTPLPEEVDADAVPSWTGALSVALGRRPELVEQRLLVEAAEVRHVQRLSERRPALDLSLTGSSRGFSGHTEAAFHEAVAYDFPTWQAAFTFSYPLANTSATEAERSAWAGLRSARLAYDQIETRIAAEVRDAVRQAGYQAQAVRAAMKSLDLARRRLDAEQRRRETGTATNFEVLTFQEQLAQALSTERTARVAYAKARVALRSAQGLFGEEPPR